MVLVKLSHGAIEAIMRDEKVENPVVQILGIKKYQFSGTPHRFRLCLSDGVHTYCNARLTKDLNHLVEDNVLEKYTVIKIIRMNCFLFRGTQRIIIPLEVEVIARGIDIEMKLDNPIPWLKENVDPVTVVTNNLSRVNLKDSPIRATKRHSPISSSSGKRYKQSPGSDPYNFSQVRAALPPSNGADIKCTFSDNVLADRLSMATIAFIQTSSPKQVEQ